MRQGEIVVTDSVSISGRHDLAIDLHRQSIGLIKAAAEIGGEQAIATEGGVQAAIGIVAHQGEIIVTDNPGISGDQDLAIGLHRHSLGIIIAATDSGGEQTIAAEGGVQTAIGVVAHQGEIIVTADPGIPSNYDLAIGLHRHITGYIMAAADSGGEQAIAAEGGVQTAIGIVARQGEIVVTASFSIPGDHDPAIGLHRHGMGIIIVAAEIGGEQAIAAEGGVQAAIGVVAHQGEIVVTVSVSSPGGHNLAIGLQGNSKSSIIATAESGDDQAVAAEGSVQAAGRGRCPGQLAEQATGIVALHREQVAFRVAVVGQHVVQVEGSIFVGGEAGAAVIHGGGGKTAVIGCRQRGGERARSRMHCNFFCGWLLPLQG